MRVRDLHEFREVIRGLVGPPDIRFTDRVSVVPTRGAAHQLERTIGADGRLPRFVTRDELYTALHSRLRPPPGRLTAIERDAIVHAAASEAQATLPPPGL